MALPAASGLDVGDLPTPPVGAFVRLHPMWVVSVVLVLLALLIGRVNEPPALYDDAAIGFRYSERLADGLGLTYNDHEKVMGFSNPLWTVLLAGARVLGLPMVGTARVLAVLLLMASAVLAGLLGRRLSNVGGGLTAGVLLLGMTVYVQQMVSGMEVGLTVTLGLAAVLAASWRREVLTGVLLGLAVLSKLEAGLLCLALAGGWWWAYRRPPWRMALAAAATVAPWALFATIYYGSPVPNSFVTKLGDEYRVFDRTWVVKQVDLSLAVLAAGFGAVCLRSAEPHERVVVVALGAWFVSLLVILSLVDFGDNYPWYLTGLFPPMAILAGAGLGRLVAPGALTVDRRWLAPGLLVGVVLVFTLWDRLQELALEPVLHANVPAGVLAVGGMLAVLAWFRVDDKGRALLRLGASAVAVALVGMWWVRASRQEPFADLARSPYAEFEVDRMEAGQAVARLAEPGEVVATGWGWPAYEAIDNPVLDESGLNMKVAPPGRATWHTEPGFPFAEGATAPAGLTGYRFADHITHTCRMDPRFSWYSVYVRVGSPADERAPHPPAIPARCGPAALAAAVAAGTVPPG